MHLSCALVRPKAAVNRTHSRRFARVGCFQTARSVWSACGLPPLSARGKIILLRCVPICSKRRHPPAVRELSPRSKTLACTASIGVRPPPGAAMSKSKKAWQVQHGLAEESWGRGRSYSELSLLTLLCPRCNGCAQPKAVEDYRTPRRYRADRSNSEREASWSAPVLWRFYNKVQNFTRGFLLILPH